jgi:uncharacterized membrane protein YfcA
MDFLFGLTAFLYSLVGHAGASSYTPLALASGLDPASARSAALLLNLLVSGLGILSFGLAGHLRAKLLPPLLLGSMPFAYFGSKLQLQVPLLHYATGLALLWAAWRLTLGWKQEAPEGPQPEGKQLFAGGMALGLLSGITGIGGGIYLSPFLLFMRWASAKEAAALSACFIFFNSAASLFATGVKAVPQPSWILACLAGGLLGSTLGAGLLPSRALRGALGCALLFAASKAFLQ